MSTKKENIGKKLVDEVGKANQYYTNNYNDSVKALNDIGIKSNYEKYINSTTGHLNQTGLNAQKAAEEAAEKAAKEAAEKAKKEAAEKVAKEKKNGVSHRGRQQNAESSELEVDNTTETQDSLQTNGISDKGFQNNDKLPDVNHETTIPETNTHKIPISELPDDASLDDLLNVDVSLPPELQEIADMPVGMGDPDLMSDVMTDLPEGFAADGDLWASLKDLVGGVLDMMG